MENRSFAAKNRIWALLCACSGAWAVQFHYGLAAADRGAGLFDLLLTAALYLFFKGCFSIPASPGVKKRAAWLAAAFVAVLCACEGWLYTLRYGQTTNLPLTVLYFFNAAVGTYLLFSFGLRALLAHLSRVSLTDPSPVDGRRARRWFLLAFAACFAVYFVFLLNQYPGSMESDHWRQLKTVLAGRLENRNPLVSSLLVLFCVRTVLAFGGTMNGGVFCYSIVQLALLSAVFGYAVSLLYRAGFRRAVLAAATAFFAACPYNIFYSYGMWKDTFFAVWLLLTVLLFWRVLLFQKAGEAVPPRHWLLLFLSAAMASLARNSGWTALLIWLPFLLLLPQKNAVRRGAVFSVGAGVAAALLLMGPVYSALGVEKTADVITTSCVPLQQIGAVIVAEKPLTDEQAALLEAAVDVETVRKTYRNDCADPMKDECYKNLAYIEAHLGAYGRLWVELGLKYPMTYLRAYRDLMRMYLDPGVSSEVAYKWIYPNELGVYRDPKLLPALDFGYYELLLELPLVNLVKRPGAILWAMAILWNLCALRNNRRARLLFLPFLAVYAGLFITAPVALFRYVYSAAAALPLLLLWPFWQADPPPAAPGA